MTYARLYAAIILAAGLIFSLTGGAYAAVITNLDSKPHSIEADGTPVTIAAGETWRVPGKAKVTCNGLTVHMEDNDEYAIWNDKDFAPQRRQQPGAGAVGN